MDIKGWISFDFVVASLMILMIMEGMISITGERLNTSQSVNTMVLARTVSENLGEYLDTVYSGGEGCYIIYTTPRTITKNSYMISLNPNDFKIVINGKIGSSYHVPVKLMTNTGFYTNRIMFVPGESYIISNNKVDGYTFVVIRRLKEL